MKKYIVFILSVLLIMGTYLLFESRQTHYEVIPKQLKPTQIPTPTVVPTIYISEYISITMPHDGKVYNCKRLNTNTVKEASIIFGNAKTEKEKCDPNQRVKDAKCEEDCIKVKNDRDLECIAKCTFEAKNSCNELVNKMNKAELSYTTLFEENCNK